MKAPLGVILAGGQAKRMGGGDKGLLKLGAATVLSHVIERLEPQVPAIMINANGDADRFASFGFPVRSDSIDGFAGPLAGVLSGLDWAASEGADHIVSVAADTPFFPCDLVPRLLHEGEISNMPIVLAATPSEERPLNRHPTFGLWPVALRDDLRGSLDEGTRKVVVWAEKHGVSEAVFDAQTQDPFFNVNTPEDLVLANTMVGQ